MLPPENTLATGVLALLLCAAPCGGVLADSPEEAIRSTLRQWTTNFNNKNADEVCNLFARDLRYDFRGYPERGYDDICTLLHRSLRDESKRYTYDLDIREIIVSGDLAVVRLTWTLNVTLANGQIVTTVEPGMDVLRKGQNNQWKIVRYLAFEQAEPPRRDIE